MQKKIGVQRLRFKDNLTSDALVQTIISKKKIGVHS